eukprot:CAMPEP_0170542506 /NCGR_PEP_ID=MMETSP0211-20121228/1902_1 /TAXON_ID=311385 /ORGANISM="Pseudokeronopsis sp., Strain OXSARD2" /LENGTH=84 /DNA_ID=CAMNT_0010845579 /DNA_START=528 /DNA_END=782 /DNA_ORIENTATION=+
MEKTQLSSIEESDEEENLDPNKAPKSTKKAKEEPNNEKLMSQIEKLKNKDQTFTEAFWNEDYQSQELVSPQSQTVVLVYDYNLV